MITLKIWHGPMRTTLTLSLPDGKLQQDLVNAFRTVPSKVTADEISPQALSALDGKKIDLDELNFLARSLEQFTPYEQEQFFAAAQTARVSALKALINLSFNMDRYTLVQNTTDLAAIGRKHLLNKQGGIPVSELDKIDFEQEGRDLLASGNGIPTTYGLFFEDRDTPYREVYDSTTFPYYEHSGGAIAVSQLEYGLKTEYLYLTEDELAITKAAWRLGAPTPDICKAELTDFMVDDPVWMRHLENMLRDEGIRAANDLAAVFPKSSDGMEKLAAVVEYADVCDSRDILRLAAHLDDFVFIKAMPLS